MRPAPCSRQPNYGCPVAGADGRQAKLVITSGDAPIGAGRARRRPAAEAPPQTDRKSSGEPAESPSKRAPPTADRGHALQHARKLHLWSINFYCQLAGNFAGEVKLFTQKAIACWDSLGLCDCVKCDSFISAPHSSGHIARVEWQFIAIPLVGCAICACELYGGRKVCGQGEISGGFNCRPASSPSNSRRRTPRRTLNVFEGQPKLAANE